MSNVTVTVFTHGPFEIVVTDPNNLHDRAYPAVISPEGGYQSVQDALQYIEKHFAHRKTPYLDLHFRWSHDEDHLVS